MRLIKLIAALVLILSVSVMSACKTDSNSDVTVAGSTSVQPYAEILDEEFSILYPETKIDIQGGGSAAGIEAAITGTAAIGMSSRALTDDEKSTLAYVVEIAKDGIAIIVHPDNPIRNLTMQEVCDIYSGKITNWNEVGGHNANIHIVTREDGSGTRSSFQDLVMGKNNEISPKAIVQDSNGAVRLLVSDDPDSIGFISLGLVEPQEGQKPVIALNLDGIAATRENVINGSYRLYRPFLFVSKSEPIDSAKEFIDFTLSKEGQQILIKEGLIPE